MIKRIYLLCKKEGATWISDDINSEYGIRNYQHFLSNDRTRIFYNTDRAGQSGSLFYYDISKKQHIDVINSGRHRQVCIYIILTTRAKK